MARKQTKAQLILDEARNRVITAENAVSEAYRSLEGAQAGLKAHRDAYSALERSLAPKPRKAKASAKQKSLPEAN